MQNTQHTSAQSNRRSAATQAAVDRFAADPTAKAARSIELAQAHHLSAWLTCIERDCAVATVPITRLAFAVASQSQRDVTHAVEYDAATDSADCDCPAGVNGLPCGHQGATLIAGRALVRADAQMSARRAAIAREAAAWAAALDAMQARDATRRIEAQRAEAILYRNPRPFSIWRSNAD